MRVYIFTHVFILIVASLYNFISPVFLFSPATQRVDETKCTEASCVEPNVWRKSKFDLAERRTVTFMQLSPQTPGLWANREIKQRRFWATEVNHKWGLFPFYIPWR